MDGLWIIGHKFQNIGIGFPALRSEVIDVARVYC